MLDSAVFAHFPLEIVYEHALLLSKFVSHKIWLVKICSSVFPARVSLCSPGCPGTHSVGQADLELRNPPASASQVLGLQACTTTAWQSKFSKMDSQVVLSRPRGVQRRKLSGKVPATKHSVALCLLETFGSSSLPALNECCSLGRLWICPLPTLGSK